MEINKKGQMKVFLSILIIVFLILLGYALYKNSKNDIKEVCVGDKKCFIVDSVSTPEKMALGLGNRDSLEENGGMLFIFSQEEIPDFWMKGMRFPIDIVWIDKNKRIVGIEKNVQTCPSGSCPSFSPNSGIKYVLEINSGLSDMYGFSKGDVVSLN